MLGRAGRGPHPEKLHFHPGLFRYCTAHGLRYTLAAPLAHLQHPIEPFHYPCQSFIGDWICPSRLRKKLKWTTKAKSYKERTGYAMRGPRSFSQAQAAASEMIASSTPSNPWISKAIKHGCHDRGQSRYFKKLIRSSNGMKPWKKELKRRLAWEKYDNEEIDDPPPGTRPRIHEFVEVTAEEQQLAQQQIQQGLTYNHRVAGTATFAIDYDIDGEEGATRARRDINRADRLEKEADIMEDRQFKRSKAQCNPKSIEFISRDDFVAQKAEELQVLRASAVQARITANVARQEINQEPQLRSKRTRSQRKVANAEAYAGEKWQVNDVVAVKWEGEWGNMLYRVANTPSYHKDVKSTDTIGLNVYQKKKKSPLQITNQTQKTKQKNSAFVG